MGNSSHCGVNDYCKYNGISWLEAWLFWSTDLKYSTWDVIDPKIFAISGARSCFLILWELIKLNEDWILDVMRTPRWMNSGAFLAEGDRVSALSSMLTYWALPSLGMGVFLKSPSNH